MAGRLRLVALKKKCTNLELHDPHKSEGRRRRAVCDRNVKRRPHCRLFRRHVIIHRHHHFWLAWLPQECVAPLVASEWPVLSYLIS